MRIKRSLNEISVSLKRGQFPALSWTLVILLRQNRHGPDSFKKFLDHSRRQRAGWSLLQTAVILEATEEVAEILVEAVLDKPDVLRPVILIQRFKSSPKNGFLLYLQKRKNFLSKTCRTPRQKYR